jgi:hypothetical protein
MTRIVRMFADRKSIINIEEYEDSNSVILRLDRRIHWFATLLDCPIKSGNDISREGL